MIKRKIRQAKEAWDNLDTESKKEKVRVVINTAVDAVDNINATVREDYDYLVEAGRDAYNRVGDKFRVVGPTRKSEPNDADDENPPEIVHE